MKIHRYFFWIEDNFIEIYKNGNLEKYEGEEKLYIDNFETFWEKWKKNSKIIASRDAIDFTFLIDKKVNKGDLLKSLVTYKKENEINFSSEDLKKILDIKDFKASKNLVLESFFIAFHPTNALSLPHTAPFSFHP